MSRRILLFSALAVNTLIAATAFLRFGWTAAATHVAARSTARFSVFVFLLAFAQPGLVRWISSLPSYAALVHAFAVAHCVHFLAVAMTLALDRGHQLRKSPAMTAAVIGIGFAVVIASGVTAGLRSSAAYRKLHALAIYAVFAIFLLGYARHPVTGLRSIAVLLVLALALRIAGTMAARNEAAASG